MQLRETDATPLALIVTPPRRGNTICDGCNVEIALATAQWFEGKGHLVAYCPDRCGPLYANFEAAHQREAQRQQHMLELWAEDIRSRLPLRKTPVELPPLVLNSKREPMRLG